MTPVILEVAINGVTQKSRNPHVPRTPEEIARCALACLAGGAAIVHNHLDEYALDGATAAERYLAGWRPVLAERPDALLYPTIGFGESMRERYAHVPALAEAGALRLGLLDPGSLNLGGTDADGLPGGFEFVYTNTFADIRYVVDTCARLRLAPTISIFEPGFLRTALAYHRAGRLPAGALVKLYFGGDTGYVGNGSGVSFGLPPTRTSLQAYLEMLEGSGLPWAVAVLGGDVIESGMARLALERGGHLRVGLEDYAGPRSPSNEELVAEAVALCRAVGRPPATPTEAVAMLAIPT